MKKIVIVLSKDFLPGSIIGPMEMFLKVNDFYKSIDPMAAPFFHVVTAAKDKTPIQHGPITFFPDFIVDELTESDFILVPAIHTDIPGALERNESIIQWIQKMYLVQNTELISVCMGAFILGATGLLDGKKATTHWLGAELFQNMFPKVDLRPEIIITDQDGIYTSGGATTYMNLVLYIIDKYCGREVALWASKLFLVDFDKVTQNYFAMFSTQKMHRDESIKKAQRYIEENYQAPISVDLLADHISVSRRNFVRRFKKATHNTPLKYIQRVKVEAAKKQLETTSHPVSQIMYKVGYQDTKSFRKVFKNITGLTPLEYRRKYSRELIFN
jgi:transcriptional regulator GlxA family with amidase domain